MRSYSLVLEMVMFKSMKARDNLTKWDKESMSTHTPQAEQESEAKSSKERLCQLPTSNSTLHMHIRVAGLLLTSRNWGGGAEECTLRFETQILENHLQAVI